MNRPPFNPVPVTLEHTHARLVPMLPEHAAGLFAAGRNPDIWRWLPFRPFTDPSDAERWVDLALDERDQGVSVPFVIEDKASGHIAGSTRYLDIRPEHRGLEIGWTWISPLFQRTAINTECKYLLLRHAFESLAAIRVALKTDARNERSQRAIERIGAVREGVLRNHYIMPDGYFRDSVYYSVIESQWPAVKRMLEGKLSS